MVKKILKAIIPAPALSLYHYALSKTAAVLYGHPSRKLVVIGITGTKGKSTTTHLTAGLLEKLGHRTGLTSTIAFNVGSSTRLNDQKMTMLGRFATQRMLRAMLRAGCTHAVIETSSEGIAQWRHLGIEYDIAVFTNLTPEHIESHGSFEHYRAAKEKLFSHLTAFQGKSINGRQIPKIIIANADDEETERITRFASDMKIQFGHRNAELLISDEETTLTGSSFRLNNVPCSTALLGSFNILNSAAAAAVAIGLGHKVTEIAPLIRDLPPPPGRQEIIREGQPFTVMVDYAYEPVSQAKLYAMLNLFPKKRIIHVTGSAGGGRDTSRRPELGRLAAEHADIVIVTNEDPYDDDPQSIIEQVADGARNAGKKEGETLFPIADRREAIQRALTLAQPDDLVLITGKGSEQAMCVANGKKIPWDDRQIVRDVLQQLTNIHTHAHATSK